MGVWDSLRDAVKSILGLYRTGVGLQASEVHIPGCQQLGRLGGPGSSSWIDWVSILLLE